MGKETGTTFPISVQDKEVNALLETGYVCQTEATIGCCEVPKLRNASGRDIKTHGVMTAKFKMVNTIFTQFVVHDNLVILQLTIL